jgi:hypothetical protein
MAQHTANDIGVTLFPSPFVLFDFPSINYVSHKIQCFAGVVFEEVVEFVSLTVFGAKMNIADENTAIGFLHVLFKSICVTITLQTSIT